MGRVIHCVKLGIEAEGLDRTPFPGEQGQRIYQNVSVKAWEEWLKLQTMLINEYKLTPFQAKDKQFLAAEREKFLFGSGAAVPQGFVPPKA